MKRQIFLAACDRYRIKSFNYTISNGKIVIATETKQFLAFGLQPKWDVARLRDQRWLYGAYTYLKGVRTVCTVPVNDMNTETKCIDYAWSISPEQEFWISGTLHVLGYGFPRQGWFGSPSRLPPPLFSLIVGS